MKVIEIMVSPTGETRLETKGFAGSECLQASQFIETALGRKTSERRTGEFYRGHEQQATQENA